MYTIKDLKDLEKHIRQNDSNNLESWIKYKHTHITKDEIKKYENILYCEFFIGKNKYYYFHNNSASIVNLI